MKKKIIYDILHCIGLLLCLFGAVLCGGDSHPLHQKTVFDPWERPQDQTEERSTDVQETEVDGTMFSDIYETVEIPNENTTKESDEELPLLIIDQNESCPVKVTVTAEKQTTEHTYRILIRFSKLPQNHTFAYLLILYTGGTVTDLQTLLSQKNNSIHISYIKKEEIISILIDGKQEDSPDIPCEDLCIEMIIRYTVKPWIKVIYVDYYRKTDILFSDHHKIKS